MSAQATNRKPAPVVHRVIIRVKPKQGSKWHRVSVCLHCREAWQLEKPVGICPNCNRESEAHTYLLRHTPKSRARPKPLLCKSDIESVYDRLDGEWREWLEVARKYEGRVPKDDRLDMRHDILLELHRARQRDKAPIPILRAYKIASLMTALYWRKRKRQPTLISLDEPIADYEGNEVRLLDTIADDNAIDLAEWLDAKVWLSGCPMRLIEIATKKLEGKALSDKDRMYLSRYRKHTQLSLFSE